MAKSTRRVLDALQQAGIDTEIHTMPSSTRTAEEAADACNCALGQIVKSLIFEGTNSGDLYLLLVSGANQVDLEAVTAEIGEPLQRADPKDVRARTGFAIGGVSPVGHLEQPSTLIDEDLLTFDRVWAAAGAPNAVFEINPQQLLTMTDARRLKPATV
ncbi:MAG: YbaK/EbsC family protein [Pseudomonadota bacterium]